MSPRVPHGGKGARERMLLSTGRVLGALDLAFWAKRAGVEVPDQTLVDYVRAEARLAVTIGRLVLSAAGVPVEIRRVG